VGVSVERVLEVDEALGVSSIDAVELEQVVPVARRRGVGVTDAQLVGEDEAGELGEASTEKEKVPEGVKDTLRVPLPPVEVGEARVDGEAMWGVGLELRERALEIVGPVDGVYWTVLVCVTEEDREVEADTTTVPVLHIVMLGVCE